MRVLVAGGDRVDAGKTTFSVGLVARTGAVGLKPRAGNDYWFDHDDVRRAVGEGRLYGKDARRLATATPPSAVPVPGDGPRPGAGRSTAAPTSGDADGDGPGGTDPAPEAVNPVHRLWRPVPEDAGAGDFLGPEDREFVCDRVAGSVVVNARADPPAVVREGLPVEGAVRVSTVEELNAVTERRHLPAMRAAGRMARRADRAVVESYGDIADPLQGVMDADDATGAVPAPDRYDAVAVVEPGRARVYDGRRYRRGCSVAAASPYDGRMERRVGDVVSGLDPAATVDLPALEKKARSDPDRIAAAYADAYDAVLDAARGA